MGKYGVTVPRPEENGTEIEGMSNGAL